MKYEDDVMAWERWLKSSAKKSKKVKTVVLKKESTMKTVTPTSEDEDWMHSLPGYQDEGSL